MRVRSGALGSEGPRVGGSKIASFCGASIMSMSASMSWVCEGQCLYAEVGVTRFVSCSFTGKLVVRCGASVTLLSLLEPARARFGHSAQACCMLMLFHVV